MVEAKVKKEKVILNVSPLQKQQECQTVKEDLQLKEKERQVILEANQLMLKHLKLDQVDWPLKDMG